MGSPGKREAFGFLLRRPRPTRRPADLPTAPGGSPAEQLTRLVERLAAVDAEAIAVELTTDEARAYGYRSVRVVVPELMPPSFVYRNRYPDHLRLYRAPAAMGPASHPGPGSTPSCAAESARKANSAAASARKPEEGQAVREEQLLPQHPRPDGRSPEQTDRGHPHRRPGHRHGPADRPHRGEACSGNHHRPRPEGSRASHHHRSRCTDLGHGDRHRQAPLLGGGRQERLARRRATQAGRKAADRSRKPGTDRRDQVLDHVRAARPQPDGRRPAHVLCAGRQDPGPGAQRFLRIHPRRHS